MVGRTKTEEERKLFLSCIFFFPSSLHMEVVSIAERSTEQFVSLFYEQYDKQRNVSEQDQAIATAWHSCCT